MNITFNPAMNEALDLMENTSQNLFITGKAGTGKSTLLTYFRHHTKKKVVVLAPTGVAAINVSGQTIHSFFKFKHGVTLNSIQKLKLKDKKNIYKKLDAIVIDEISMVRADLLDCVDRFLRLNGKKPSLPFGGVQMIFIGDLYQLPPVVTSQEKEIFGTHYKSPYFFSAKFFENYEMTFIELNKIFRQQDNRFIHLLNAVRNETLTEKDINLLNERVKPNFEAEGYVYLTPKNSEADAINAERLEALKGKPFIAEAKIEGTFGKEYYPTRQSLTFKEGAQIMMVNNDPEGDWVNGTMGKILGFKKYEDGNVVIGVRLENGAVVKVSPHKWEINRFFLEENAIQSEVIGSFTQYPLTLAWALTIHKSQGKTFQKVILDIGSGAFMPGQVYVALSRCTSLEGLVLTKPIYARHIWSDEEVVTFVNNLKPHPPFMPLSLNEKEDFIKAALANQHVLQIDYLNTSNEKSTRLVTPTYVGLMKYQNVPYMGLRGFCHTSQEEKVFRIDRIMAIKTMPKNEDLPATKALPVNF
ncbi:MAG: AAA family ATPase [Alphaproteobacteria bacterium 41-28]|nr:MAG: AAA family ATPase [Alphaproteobacteria bacterium 41-28]